MEMSSSYESVSLRVLEENKRQSSDRDNKKSHAGQTQDIMLPF